MIIWSNDQGESLLVSYCFIRWLFLSVGKHDQVKGESMIIKLLKAWSKVARSMIIVWSNQWSLNARKHDHHHCTCYPQRPLSSPTISSDWETSIYVILRNDDQGVRRSPRLCLFIVHIFLSKYVELYCWAYILVTGLIRKHDQVCHTSWRLKSLLLGYFYLKSWIRLNLRVHLHLSVNY